MSVIAEMMYHVLRIAVCLSVAFLGYVNCAGAVSTVSTSPVTVPVDTNGQDELAPAQTERELRRELRRLERDIRREERLARTRSGGARAGGGPFRRLRRGMAIASLVLGIAAFPLYFLPTLGLAGLISAILALVFGVIARGRARKRPEEYGGRPLATAGFVLGIVGTVLPFAVLIAFVIAFQGF